MIPLALKRLLEPVRKNGVFDVATAMAKGRVEAIDDGESPVRWLITNRNDEIQSRQIAAGYYERAELDQLKSDLGERRTIVDIGANIGNHAVYFSRHFNSDRIVLVEPYEPAINHLLANLALNYSQAFQLGFLGKAVGAHTGSASIIAPTAFNIGLTSVDSSTPGKVEVLTGDAVVQDLPVDLIKIDVEGMEIDVLSGLSATLSRQRPALYIEVSDSNREAFFGTMQRFGYKVLRDQRAYGTQSNFTMVPETSTDRR